MGDKKVVVVGFDDSEHSHHALEWTLEHFFTNPVSKTLFSLVIVHAKATPATALGVAAPASTEVYALVDTDLKRQTERVNQKAKELCKKHSVEDANIELLEGDARQVICEAVEKHNASFLVVGSHGYTGLKRVVLGSVSDYCSHHAKCSVMIVKPKDKTNS